MFTFLFSYFGIALVALAADGMLCYAVGKRFRLPGSILLCAFWPLTLPVATFSAWRATRRFPDTSGARENARNR
jgi:hypothetical protein